MIETIQKLVQLTKSKDNLPTILIEGLVDEYISKNGEVEFKDRFHSLLIEDKYNVDYVLYSTKNKYFQGIDNHVLNHFYPENCYGIKLKTDVIYESELKLFESNPLAWYKIKHPKYNGRILVKNKGKISILHRWYFYLSQLVILGFKLETEEYCDRTDYNTYKQAIIYIKYKQSKHNHPLIQIALSNTNRPPKSDCYLYLLKFRIDSVEQGEKLLQYLHYFIKDLI